MFTETTSESLAMSMLQQREQREMKAIERPPKQQEKPMKAHLYNNKLTNKLPKITNSTSIDVIFKGAQSSRMVAKPIPLLRQKNKWRNCTLNTLPYNFLTVEGIHRLLNALDSLASFTCTSLVLFHVTLWANRVFYKLINHI